MKDSSKGITIPRLINRLLVAFILISVLFGVLFYMGLSPRDIYYSVVPVTASKTKVPTFTFAFYGEGENRLQKPMAVTVKDDLIYVADAAVNQVLVFDKNGIFQASIGRPGTNQGEFNFPYGLAIDDQNQLYVSDMKNQRIQVFDTNGNFVKVFPGKVSGDSIARPGGMAIRNNKLYVVDIMKNKVFVFNLNGDKLLEFGQQGLAAGQFKYPNGITVDDQENIYVADSGNNRVQVFDRRGKFIRSFDGSDQGKSISFASPRGMFIQNDMLFIVNSMSSQIWAANTNGKVYYKFGKKGDENNQFDFPVGIHISKGRIYITDSQNHGIKVYSF